MNRDKVEKVIHIFIGCSLLLLISGIFVLVTSTFFDTFTSQVIGEESVPCLDKYNRPFEDEMCTETIGCSMLGLASDYKCSDKGIKNKFSFS